MIKRILPRLLLAFAGLILANSIFIVPVWISGRGNVLQAIRCLLTIEAIAAWITVAFSATACCFYCAFSKKDEK